MANSKLNNKTRTLLREKPVIGGVLVVILYLIITRLIGSVMKILPDGIYVHYLQEFLLIGCGLVFVLICGYEWVYREKGFRKTLKAAMPIFVIQGLLFNLYDSRCLHQRSSAVERAAADRRRVADAVQGRLL